MNSWVWRPSFSMTNRTRWPTLTRIVDGSNRLSTIRTTTSPASFGSAAPTDVQAAATRPTATPTMASLLR